jgi:hypothetical protein
LLSDTTGDMSQRVGGPNFAAVVSGSLEVDVGARVQQWKCLKTIFWWPLELREVSDTSDPNSAI